MKFSHIIIESPTPIVDNGRYPVKRIVGDAVTVEADVVRDGHSRIAVALLWQREGEKTPRETAMTIFDNDRWRAAFLRRRRTGSIGIRSKRGPMCSRRGSRIFANASSRDRRRRRTRKKARWESKRRRNARAGPTPKRCARSRTRCARAALPILKSVGARLRTARCARRWRCGRSARTARVSNHGFPLSRIVRARCSAGGTNCSCGLKARRRE